MLRGAKKKPTLPLSPIAVAGLLRELRTTAASEKPLVVGGARALADALRRELVRGGVGDAVREQRPFDEAAALVYVLADEVGEEDERVLRAAERARLPIVCVLAGPVAAPGAGIPYVLPENVIQAAAGFPIEEIARRLAHALGERATPLAARLPVLRRAVSEELISRFSRQNALIGAAVFLPGADLPALTLNQIRLVLRIADAHGFEVDRERLPELLAVIGGGVGFRSLARQALGLVPIAGWVVKGGVAYAGTRALGEAALRYFERRAPVTRVAGERARFP